MALYIGTNYHPHDWEKERWKKDVELMAQAGFTTVRLGHLCWDSYEPEEGVYTFEWFDEVMDLFAQAKIGVVLDVSMRPAPVWVHKLCPGCGVYSQGDVSQPSIRRYMEDVEDPAYQYYALRFAEVLTKRYKDHPALFAFGLCNEIGDGYRSLSEYTRKRFTNWLKHKYGTVDALNTAWAARRWSRKLTSFDDVVLPENDWVKGSPEAWLDMRRFYSDA
ncbi:beta-galactosidase, partial [Eisenbergiella porci]